jgi:hypothetical protein
MVKRNDKFYFLVLVTYIFIYTQCNYVTKKMCGEPAGRQKEFIDSLNAVYKDRLTIEEVPCYPGYIQAFLKVDSSQVAFEEFEQATIKEGYVEFLVYDKDKKLIMGNTGSM